MSPRSPTRWPSPLTRWQASTKRFWPRSLTGDNFSRLSRGCANRGIMEPVVSQASVSRPMARDGQADLFQEDAQPDLFGGESTPVYQPNIDKVRARLTKILAEARAAQAMPWEPTQLSLY